MKDGLIYWIELFGCARIGSVDIVVRCDKEGAAADGADLVDGAGGACHILFFILEHPWPMLLEMQATQLFRLRHCSLQTFCLLFIPTSCCSRTVPASTQGCPAPPVPATSLTDRAAATSRSNGASRCGLVLGKPCRTVRPASASLDPLLELRIHPVGPVRLVAGHLVSNPARLVASGSTAPGRFPAKG